MSRTDQRMLWFLRRLTSFERRGFIVAWDAYTVDDFVEAFPEATRGLRVYMVGPNSSPMLNAAANRAKSRGYVVPGHIGNADAGEFNQRTWCRTWSITARGSAFLRETNEAERALP